MRTDAEILARIDAVKADDFLGFQRNQLIGFLSFAAARPFLNEGVTEEQWAQVQRPRDRDSILAAMLDYMPFAWEKANHGRGISAGRSMDHYSEWIWMLGDDLGDLRNYSFYGKDHLVRICQHYGWDSSQWDDGVRVNS